MIAVAVGGFRHSMNDVNIINIFVIVICLVTCQKIRLDILHVNQLIVLCRVGCNYYYFFENWSNCWKEKYESQNDAINFRLDSEDLNDEP